MKRIYAILAILALGGMVYSQPSSPSVVVPHTVSVQPHTGQMQYDISLCSLKDPDFDIGLHLTYTSDGFRPLAYSGIAGQNWAFSLGGSITRQTRGFPDDVCDFVLPNNSAISNCGFLEFLKQIDTLEYYSQYNTEEEIFEHSGIFESAKDASSDLYNFSFCGHSGSFVIGWDGRARCLTGDIVSVDLSGMTIQSSDDQSNSSYLQNFKVPNASQIRLTTLDGYQYIFGGSLDALDFSYNFPHPTESTVTKPSPVIAAWHLRKIISPCGREINLYYQSHNLQQYSYNEYGRGAHYINGELRFSSLLSSSLSPIDFGTFVGEIDSSGIWGVVNGQTISKTCLLDSVTASDNSFKIILGYRSDSDYVYTHFPQMHNPLLPSTFPLKYSKPLLQTIDVTTTSDTIASWTLSYAQIRIGSKQLPRQYLSSVKTFGGIGYSFVYDFDNISDITQIDTLRGIDMYGYTTNPYHYKIGSLRQARDILGGRTFFEYEQSGYDSIRIFYNSDSGLQPILRKASGSLLHGVRIREIEVRDASDKVYLKKLYTYGYNPNLRQNVRDLPDLLPTNDGVLNIDYAILTDSANGTYLLRGNLQPQSLDYSVLEYNKVTETVFKNGSNSVTYKNIYYYDTTNDSVDYKSFDNDRFFEMYSCVSQWKRRQKLACLERFDNTGALSSRTQYAYTSVKTDSYVVNITGLVCKTYYPQALTKSVQETRYETNGSISERREYVYDKFNRLKTEDIYAGTEHRFRSCVYVDDLFATDTFRIGQFAWGCWLMNENKRIQLPIETTIGYVRNGIKYVTASSLTLHKLYESGGHVQDDILPVDSGGNNFGLRSVIIPPEIYVAYAAPYAAMELRLSEPVSDFSPVAKVSGRVVADSRYDTIATYSYNASLRPVKIEPYGGTAKHIEWDSKGLNVLLERIGARTTTYTWKPYIGMTSSTDAEGNTIYYRYNSLGQLIEVYRMNGNVKEVLNYYEYHYPVVE